MLKKQNVSIVIIAATIIAILATFIATSFFGKTLEKRFVSDIYSRLSELSVNNASSINSKIADQFEMMYTLSSYLAGEDLHGEKVLTTIKKTVASYGFNRCAITFPDGSFITHDSKNGGNTASDEYVIEGFQGNPTITGPRTAVVGPQKTVVLLTVPIYHQQQIIALLTCTYDTTYLENVFQMTSFDGKGYSYIANSDGKIISSPALPDLVYDGDNILTFLQETAPDSHSEIEKRVAAMQSGTVALEIDGHQKYVSYQPLGINQWYVFSVTSGEVLETQLNTMLNSVYWLTLAITATLLLLMGLIWLYISMLQKKSRSQLQKLAYYDSLTEIPNRNLFETETRRILDTFPGEYAYIILNVNKFKLVNDIFGFSQGDKLLKHIAETLSREGTRYEAVSRFDADNFHILSLFYGKGDLDARMRSVSEKIREFRFEEDVPYNLSVSFGAYIIEDKSMPISLMGDKARIALSKIKGIHSTTTSFYDREFKSQLMAEQEIENSMQSALENGEMKLYLQPKCSAESHEVRSTEALVRWESPTKGLIMPDSFIPLFEKNRFIIRLDMYMIEIACKRLREWTDKRLTIYPISVNQSRPCLYQPGYIDKLLQILNTYDISPSLIEIEITERAFLEEESKIIEIIAQLHSFGFNVAMDDFGSGNSSLNMLQDALVDVLKIDKNFFRESINSERGTKIVTNIVAMANDLNIEVVAEGIETKEQLDFLKEIHCGTVQGFFFSKPLPADEFTLKYCKQAPEAQS